MKSKIYFLIIFLFSNYLAHGQEFARVGTKWTFEKAFLQSLRVPKVFSISGIDTIGGKLCKKIESEDEYPFDINYFYQENDKIYFHKTIDGLDTFLLFFDYSVKVGDTLNIGIRDAGFFENDEGSKIYSINIKIDSITYENYCDNDLKVWYISAIENNNIRNCIEISEKFIENVGYNRLFIPYVGCLDPPMEIKIRCFQSGYDSDICKFVEYECDYHSGVYNPENDSKLNCKIYPNPAKDIITIFLPQNNNWQIWNIFDLTGRLCINGTIDNKANLIISNLKNLGRGMYFLKVYDDKGRVGVDKFVVE